MRLRFIGIIVWIMILWCISPCIAAEASELSAGVSVSDITPPIGHRMSGYFGERISTGTLNPLHARAIVFAQDDTRAALVFCELIGVPLEVSSRARQLASEKTGIPVAHIVVAGTHVHTGPLFFGALRDHLHRQAVARDGEDRRETINYGDVLTDRIVEAIIDAQKATRPVRVEAGVGRETRLSFNRRFHMKDGPVRFNPGQKNPNIVRPAGPIDPDVGILLLRDPAEGRPLASLTVFAMHTDTVGGTLYAGDYPFHLERGLRKELGEEFVSIFGLGTCGDINHIDVTIEGRRSAEEIGTMLAGTVRATLPSLDRIEQPSLAVRSVAIQVPLQRYDARQVAQAVKDMDLVSDPKTPFLDRVSAYKIVDLQRRKGPTVEVEVQAIRLGPRTAIVTLPGEVFADLGLAIKKGSPFPTTLVIELANDALAYVPTRKAFSEGSYETVNSRIAPGGGEQIVEAAIKALNELKP